MALEITVGPPRLAINQGYGVLITDQDGQIPWPTDKGFYHSDTRVISSWQIFADGEPWELLSSGNIAYYAARIFLTNQTLHTEIGEVPERSLSLSISRSISGGVHEDLDLVNNGMTKIRIQSRNRGAQRLRRYLRGEVGQYRPTRPDQDRVVRERLAPDDDLYQQGLRAPGHHHRP